MSSRIGCGLEHVVGNAQSPVEVAGEGGVRDDLPIRGAGFQIVEPGWLRCLEGLEGVKIIIVVGSGGVARVIAADDLEVISPVRGKAGETHEVIGAQYRLIRRTA